MQMLRYSLLVFLMLINVACYSAHTSGGAKRNVTAVGFKVPKKGVTIDASYDKRLDGLIPGYKVITVALTNNSFDVIKLNPLKDKWEIEDAYGKKHRVINSIRIKDPILFARLPEKVKKLIDYPNVVPMSYTETFDLFIPEETDLENFRSVAYYSANLGESFDIVSLNQDDARRQRNTPDIELPNNFPKDLQGLNEGGPEIPTKGKFKRIKKAENVSNETNR